MRPDMFLTFLAGAATIVTSAHAAAPTQGLLFGRARFLAQAQALRLAKAPPASFAPQAASTPVYNFLDYPGATSTVAYGQNPGALTAKQYFTGGYVPMAGGNGTFYNPMGFSLTQTGTTASFTRTGKTFLTNEPIVTGDGINDHGEIAGTYQTSELTSTSAGFLLNGNNVTTLQAPFAGTLGTAAYDLNNSGEVVGVYYVSAGGINGVPYGFSYKAGTWTALANPAGGQFSVPLAINTAGTIVGQYGDLDFTYQHGFILQHGAYQTIDPPASIFTYVTGINDSGTVVGSYCTTQDCISTGYGIVFFTYSNGTYTDVTLPWPAATTLLYSDTINNAGTILGNYQDQAGYIHSFTITP